MLEVNGARIETVQKYKVLALKKVTVNTPLGPLTAKELQTKLDLLPYDAYENHDVFIGKTTFWNLPAFTEKGCNNLRFAILNIDRYKELRNEYKKLISEDPIVLWHLIFMLICGSEIKENFPPLADLPDWNTPKLLGDKELFQALIEDGAKYKHYLASAYQGIEPEDLKHYLNLFGNEATFPIRESLDLFSSPLVSERNPHTFEIVGLFLSAGANINARIGDPFNNTILHYLAALEDQEYVIKLIKLVEKMSTVQPIDYTLQDKFGKTILHLAVGLGLEIVVDQLLEMQQKKQRDIGINLVDLHGRTAVMIAAALGYEKIYRKLIAQGANCSIKDHEQRGLEWYRSAPLEEIRNILQSFSVNPERGYYCPLHSYLYSGHEHAVPWVLVDHDDKEHLLVLSAKEEHYELLSIALFFTELDDKNYIIKQLLPLTEQFGGPHYKKSIADRCKENQMAANNLYNSKQPGDEKNASKITLGILTDLPQINNLSLETTNQVSLTQAEEEKPTKLYSSSF